MHVVMRTFNSLFLSVIASSVPLFSQVDAAEYGNKVGLRPADSFYVEHAPDYRLLLRQLLVDRLPGRWHTAVLVQPSFDPESFVTVTMDKTECMLRVARAETNIWFARMEDKTARPAVHVQEKALPLAEAQRLRELWTAAARATRFVQDERVLLDGIAHRFFVEQKHFGVMAMECRSPAPDSLAAAMVFISDVLAEFGSTGKESEAVVLERLRAALTVGEALVPQDREQMVRETARNAILLWESVGTFKVRNGRLPKSLKELSEEIRGVYIQRPIPLDAWGRDFLLRVETEYRGSFLVLSAGPDGKLDTADDIRSDDGMKE